MKIPLTLAIVDGMKVTVGDSIFTIPIANIRQSFKVKADQVIKDEYGNEMENVLTIFILSSASIPSITFQLRLPRWKTASFYGWKQMTVLTACL